MQDVRKKNWDPYHPKGTTGLNRKISYPHSLQLIPPKQLWGSVYSAIWVELNPLNSMQVCLKRKRIWVELKVQSIGLTLSLKGETICETQARKMFLMKEGRNLNSKQNIWKGLHRSINSLHRKCSLLIKKPLKVLSTLWNAALNQRKSNSQPQDK